MNLPDDSVPGYRVVQGQEPGTLAILAEREHPEWTVFAGLSHVIPTTILYRGEHWRIASMEPGAKGGLVYQLVPWPERDPVRRLFEFTALTFAEKEAEAIRSEALRQRSKYALAVELLTGWLPARIQHQHSDDWGTSPQRASWWNAFILFSLGGALAIPGFLFPPLFIVAMALIVDGGLRAMWLWSGREGSGVVFLEFLDWVWLTLIKGEKSDQDLTG